MKTLIILKKTITITITIFSLIVLVSCNSLKTALYDLHSYEQSISLKVEAISLMNNAVAPYTDYQEDITNYIKAFDKLKEYEKNKANNQLSFKMISLIGNPDKNLLGGFFKRWKEKNTLSPFFIEEAQGQISEAFDILIRYESKKDKEEINNFLLN